MRGLHRPRALGANLLGGGGGAAWSPKNITGLSLWLRADDLSSNDGDAITTWTSKEGNAYAFAQADPTKRPLLKTAANGINGRNVVRFDGSNDLLVLPSAPLTGTAGTVIAVYRLSASPTDYQHILSSSDEATTNFNMRFMAYYSSTLKFMASSQYSSPDTKDELYGSTTIVAGEVYAATWQSDGSAYTMRLNRTNQTLVAASGANSGDWFGDVANRDNTVIGALKRTSESTFLKGDIAEILVYDHKLTVDEQTSLERYLDGRYFQTAQGVGLQAYGGLGNDSYDNTAAFTAAINDMNTRGGGTIYLPTGTYRAVNNVTWKSGVSLVGDGTTKSIVKFVNGSQFIYSGAIGSELQNCLFQDFDVDGSVQTGWTKGFFFAYCKGLTFRRVKCLNTGATGFGNDYMVNCLYDTCTATGCGRTGTVDGAGNSGFGIGTGKYQTENVRLVDCVAGNNKRYGIFFEAQGSGDGWYTSRGAEIVGGSSSSNQWGIGDLGVDGLLVDGVTVQSNLAEGIYVGGPGVAGSYPGVNGTIQNCEVSLNGAAGIRPVAGGVGYTLTNNNVHDNGT